MTINDSKTRPMMEVAREGIFSSLQFKIDGSMILDLYCLLYTSDAADE